MKKILIVDDQIHIAKALGYALKKRGYEIEYSKNGLEALEKLQNYTPHLMLLDMMMPLMTGIELLAELKKNEKLGVFPIVMVSARGKDENVEEALKIGADDYVVKPFSVADVIARVDEILVRKNEGV